MATNVRLVASGTNFPPIRVPAALRAPTPARSSPPVLGKRPHGRSRAMTRAAA